MNPLNPSKMNLQAEYMRAAYHVEVDPSTLLSDVTIPKFWCHYAMKLRRHDLIDVIGQGFDVTLRVQEVGTGYAKVNIIRQWLDKVAALAMAEEDPASIEASIPDGYVIDHTPKTLWRARLKDGAVEISRNHKTKIEAIASAVGHFNKVMGIAA